MLVMLQEQTGMVIKNISPANYTIILCNGTFASVIPGGIVPSSANMTSAIGNLQDYGCILEQMDFIHATSF